MRINPRLFFREAYLSIRRNFVMTSVAIIQVVISLLLVGTLAIVIYDSRQVINAVEREVEISVYLEDDIPEEFFNKYKDEIRSWNEIRNVEYRSKEEAMEKFKENLDKGSAVLEIIDPDILPASFEISLKNPQTVEDVASRFEDGKIFDLKTPEEMEEKRKEEGKEKGEEEEKYYWKWIDNNISYGEKYVGTFFRVTNTIRIITFLIISLLFISSIILIFNTIRLSIISRKKEIEVMKLVGASNWYVRWPFIIEGTIQGIIGALIAIGLIFIINMSFLKRLEDVFNNLFTLPLNLAITGTSPLQFQIFLVLFVTGTLIGAVGSLIALRKFIKI